MSAADGERMEMRSTRILLVEDDPDIHDTIAPYLARRGWNLAWARSIAEAIRALERESMDLVLLDRGLPGASGDHLARRLADGTVPFIMLTARAAEFDRIAGFDLGADDYVTKPFSAAELVRRMDVALRRRGLQRIIIAAGIEVDRDARIVRIDGRDAALTATEYAIVELLALRPGRVFRRSELVDTLQLDFDTSERSIDSHVKNVRKKLSAAAAREEILETVIGVGYTIRAGT